MSKVKNFYGRHPLISNIIILLFAALLVGWCMMFFLDIWTHHGDTAKVPDVRNLNYVTAIQTLEQHGFKAEVSDSVYDPNFKPGQVKASWPRPGAIVKPGREVYLTISSYQTKVVTVEMPLVDVSSRQAIDYLQNTLKIKNIRIEKVPSQFADLVEGAFYDGKPVTIGSRLPVTATVVLKVGVVPALTEVDAADNDEFNHKAMPTTTFEDDEESSTAYD